MRRIPTSTALRRGGFTFVELAIGLAMLTLVGGALLAVILAVGSSWRAADGMQSAHISGRQSSAQLYRLLHSAVYVGVATEDGTAMAEGTLVASVGAGGAVMFWRGDANGDGKMQLGEVALIERNVADNTLVLYEAPGTAWNASLVFEVTDIDDSADAAAFKTLNTVTGRVLARDIGQAKFVRRLTAGLDEYQAVEFVLKVKKQSPDAATLASESAWERTEYGMASLRGARAPKAGA